MDNAPFTRTIYQAAIEQHSMIRTTDMTEITRLYQKDLRKSICVTLATKFAMPFQVSLVGRPNTPAVVIAVSFFSELIRISTIGYIQRMQIIVSIIVATGLFFLFSITAEPP